MWYKWWEYKILVLSGLMSRYDDYIKCVINFNYFFLIYYYYIIFVIIFCIILVWFMIFKKINDVFC